MDIGDVAKQSSLPPSTLRYYEKLGLVKSNGRKGLRRLFSPHVVKQLALITLARNAGFSLSEVGEILAHGQSLLDRQVLNNKMVQLDQKIQQLSAARDVLSHIANCPQDDQFACDKFQQLLKTYAKRQNTLPFE